MGNDKTINLTDKYHLCFSGILHAKYPLYLSLYWRIVPWRVVNTSWGINDGKCIFIHYAGRMLAYGGTQMTERLTLSIWFTIGFSLGLAIGVLWTMYLLGGFS